MSDGTLGLIANITPSDDNLLSGLLYIGFKGAGTVAIKGTRAPAEAVTFPVTAGMLLPFSEGYIMATGTTAGLGIIGFGG